MPSKNNNLEPDDNNRAHFAGYVFDKRSNELFKDGALVHLPLQNARLLSLLIERSKQVVTRDEIQSALWPDRHVDFEAGINTIIRNIRRALGDDPAHPTIIETIPKRGYRFLLTPDYPETARGPTPVNLSGFPPRRRLAAAALAGIVFIAGILLLSFRQDGQNPAEDLAALQSPAYEPFLFGSQAMKEGKFERAQAYFRDALEQDESFAPAFAGLAHAMVLSPGRTMSTVADAQSQLDQALSLSPDLVSAIHLNARLALYYWRDLKLARQEITRARALAPNDPDILTTAAYFHTIDGDPQAALDAIASAHKLKPLSPSLNADYGWVHYKARNWADAERLCKTSVEMDPRSQFALECVIHINHSQGDFAEAVEYGAQLMKLRGAKREEINAIRQISNAADRERAYWEWTLNWIDKNNKPNRFPKRAIALGKLGRLEEAAQSLNQAFIRNGEPILSFVAVDPRFDEMRRHPEFTELAEQSQQPVAM